MTSIGNPVEGICPSGSAFVANGCLGGDYTYTLYVESSQVPLVDVRFFILNVTGAPITAPGPSSGFSVVDLNGSVLAQYSAAGSEMNMTSSWTYGNDTSSTTILTDLDNVVLDIGDADPVGKGFTFVADFIGVGGGTTSPITLP